MKIPTFVLLLVSLPCFAAAGDDACRAQLPASLVSALGHDFPSLRLPLVSDNLAEDVEFSKSRGGNSCLGVASGDFDGNGEKDFVVGLSASGEGAPTVVVALANKGKWTFRTIDSWVSHRSRLYVDAIPPARADRTQSLDGDLLLPGERDSMVCPHEGIIVGATESTGIVYCFIESTWSYVRVSD